MGFLDKLKAGAEQAKEMAADAAERAKQEAKELQLKREIGQAQSELGRIAFDLVERGELSHAELAGGVERIRSLKAELSTLEAKETSAPLAAETPEEGGEPSSE